ncbi:hypothetical protein C8R44DRAFT_855411, partial [Mycena epipterygia]
MRSVTTYYDSFKHPGRKYAAWVDTLPPAHLQRLEADLRRQDKENTTLAATVLVTSVVSHGILAPVGAAATFAADYRRDCAHDKLVVVREAMEARGIPVLPETFALETLAPLVMGPPPTPTGEKTDTATTESYPSGGAVDAKTHVPPSTVPQTTCTTDGIQQKIDTPRYSAPAGATNSRPRSYTVTRGGKAAVEEAGRVVGDAVNWAKESVARNGGGKAAVEEVGRVVGDGVRWAKERVHETSLKVAASTVPRPPSRVGGRVPVPISTVPPVPPMPHTTRMEASPREASPPAYYVGTPAATPQPDFYTVGKRAGITAASKFPGTAGPEVDGWEVPQSVRVWGV